MDRNKERANTTSQTHVTQNSSTKLFIMHDFKRHQESLLNVQPRKNKMILGWDSKNIDCPHPFDRPEQMVDLDDDCVSDISEVSDVAYQLDRVFGGDETRTRNTTKRTNRPIPIERHDGPNSVASQQRLTCISCRRSPSSAMFSYDDVYEGRATTLQQHHSNPTPDCKVVNEVSYCFHDDHVPVGSPKSISRDCMFCLMRRRNSSSRSPLQNVAQSSAPPVTTTTTTRTRTRVAEVSTSLLDRNQVSYEKFDDVHGDTTSSMTKLNILGVNPCLDEHGIPVKGFPCFEVEQRCNKTRHSGSDESKKMTHINKDYCIMDLSPRTPTRLVSSEPLEEERTPRKPSLLSSMFDSDEEDESKELAMFDMDLHFN